MNKTGEGRSRPQVRIVHAEDAPCPAANPTLPDPGGHTLTNDKDAVTFCQWCGMTWVHIDQLIRATHPTKKETVVYDDTA